MKTYLLILNGLNQILKYFEMSVRFNYPGFAWLYIVAMSCATVFVEQQS
jgi:hypothetical protein